MLEGGTPRLAIGAAGAASKVSGSGVGSSAVSTVSARTMASFGANLQSLIEALGAKTEPTSEQASAATKREQTSGQEKPSTLLIPSLSIPPSLAAASEARSSDINARQPESGQNEAVQTRDAQTSAIADAKDHANPQQESIEKPEALPIGERLTDTTNSGLMLQTESSGAPADEVAAKDGISSIGVFGSVTEFEARQGSGGAGLYRSSGVVLHPARTQTAAITAQTVLPAGPPESSTIAVDAAGLDGGDEIATTPGSVASASQAFAPAHTQSGVGREIGTEQTAATDLNANGVTVAQESSVPQQTNSSLATSAAGVRTIKASSAATAGATSTEDSHRSEKRHGAEQRKPNTAAAALTDAVVVTPGTVQLPLPLPTQTWAPALTGATSASATEALDNSLQARPAVMQTGDADTKTRTLNVENASAVPAYASRNANSQVVNDAADSSATNPGASSSLVNFNDVGTVSSSVNQLSSSQGVEDPLTLSAHYGANREVDAAEAEDGPSQGQIANPAAVQLDVMGGGVEKTASSAKTGQFSPVLVPRVTADNAKYSASRNSTAAAGTAGLARDKHAAGGTPTNGTGVKPTATTAPATEKTAVVQGGATPSTLTKDQSANGAAPMNPAPVLIGTQDANQIANLDINQLTNQVVVQNASQASAEAGAAGSGTSISAEAIVSSAARSSSAQKPRSSVSVEDRGPVVSGHSGMPGMANGPESSLPQAHAASQAGVNSALMRDLNDSDGSGLGRSLSNGTSSNLPLTPAGHSGDDTFAALDGGTTSAAPTWTHAGTQRAEAGYLDPALGWVGVRADSSGSGLHASVVPGSAEAAQVLGGHLSGLNAYLAENPGQKATVTMDSPENHGGGFQSNQGQGQGSSQQNNGDGNPQVYQAVRTQPEQSMSGAQDSSSAISARGLVDGTAYNSGDGAHISVVA